MTATYTNQPGIRDIDTVRFEVDDRDCDPETDAVLSDEEIQYLIDGHTHILLAAAAAAEQIGGTYAAQPSSKTVGDLSVTYGERALDYKELAKSLRTRAAKKAGAGIYAGGLSRSEKKTEKAKPDLVQPAFRRDQDDHIETDGYGTDRGVMDY